ncbi:FadR/GntR family transcriptional regulator [Roseibium aggregatum]|uniref:FadR family transcriptional regulator n=1 Tax=Roseibium aggregatum TaxID=187304 RepID=A0A926P141_9HYPH|nr:FCD domain-containing protein [Roseibium aggregatum]MBD1544901.1 FadR family transcriptional regulator [Roseibium aggregatum]
MQDQQEGQPILGQIDKDPGYIRVAKAIEAEIVAGRLKVGELLPTEAELSGLLGVNRSTVREGIRALENAALVRRGDGKRLVISAPEPHVITKVNTRAMRMMRVSFLELWEVQMKLEPFAAQLAAEHRTSDQADALQANVAELKANLDDDDFIIRSDVEFHRLISEAGGNPVLSLATAPVGQLLYSATVDLYARVPQARHRLAAAHEAIARAIADGDAHESERWAARHIQDFKRGYEVGGFDMTAPLPMRD